jgi:hypothetical protein
MKPTIRLVDRQELDKDALPEDPMVWSDNNQFYLVKRLHHSICIGIISK